MTYERFLKIGLTLQKKQVTINELNKNGIDMYEFVDDYYIIIEQFIEEIYGEEGSEWWFWFCYQTEFGQKDHDPPIMKDKKGNIKKMLKDKEPNSWEAIYKFLEKNFKNNHAK